MLYSLPASGSVHSIDLFKSNLISSALDLQQSKEVKARLLHVVVGRLEPGSRELI